MPEQLGIGGEIAVIGILAVILLMAFIIYSRQAKSDRETRTALAQLTPDQNSTILEAMQSDLQRLETRLAPELSDGVPGTADEWEAKLRHSQNGFISAVRAEKSAAEARVLELEAELAALKKRADTLELEHTAEKERTNGLRVELSTRDKLLEDTKRARDDEVQRLATVEKRLEDTAGMLAEEQKARKLENDKHAADMRTLLDDFREVVREQKATDAVIKRAVTHRPDIAA